MISVIGIIGNIAVFIVVTKSPQMRTLTNQFIANLAVADLFVNILCVPFTLVSNLYPGAYVLIYIHFFVHGKLLWEKLQNSFAIQKRCYYLNCM